MAQAFVLPAQAEPAPLPSRVSTQPAAVAVEAAELLRLAEAAGAMEVGAPVAELPAAARCQTCSKLSKLDQ